VLQQEACILRYRERLSCSFQRTRCSKRPVFYAAARGLDLARYDQLGPDMANYSQIGPDIALSGQIWPGFYKPSQSVVRFKELSAGEGLDFTNPINSV